MVGGPAKCKIFESFIDRHKEESLEVSGSSLVFKVLTETVREVSPNMRDVILERNWLLIHDPPLDLLQAGG